MKFQKLCTTLVALLLSYSYTVYSQEIIADASEKSSSGLPAPQPAVEEAPPDQDDKNKFTFSGSVDAYYHASFGGEESAPGTSFANLSGFALGTVNLVGTYNHDKFGVVADLVFGPRGYDAVFNSSYTNQHIINQLLIRYDISDVVSLNIGQFNTFLGYEVISPTGNFHYSTSYMFSYGPFSHTGLRADFTFKNGLAAKAAIMNPTDHVEFDDLNAYSFGGQLGYTKEKGSLWLNLLYGDQDGALKNADPDADGKSEGATLQADITGGWNFSEKFYVGLNATYRIVQLGEELNASDQIVKSSGQKKGFSGLAIYPKLSLSEHWAVGIRAEYFHVKNNYINPIGLDENGDGNVIDLTMSANYVIGNLTIIPEYRIDLTSENTFTEKDSTLGMNNLSTINIAAVFKF